MKFVPKITIACALFIAFTALVFGLFSPYAEEKPEDTVKNIYNNIYNENSASSSLDAPETIYETTLLSLIRMHQQRQMSSGELGNLSADPLCNCQDPSAIEVNGVSSKHTERDKATVLVDLSNSGTQEIIALDLIKENGRWMISDVLTRDVPSLKKALTAG